MFRPRRTEFIEKHPPASGRLVKVYARATDRACSVWYREAGIGSEGRGRSRARIHGFRSPAATRAKAPSTSATRVVVVSGHVSFPRKRLSRFHHARPSTRLSLATAQNSRKTFSLAPLVLHPCRPDTADHPDSTRPKSCHHTPWRNASFFLIVDHAKIIAAFPCRARHLLAPATGPASR
jgi:hypothetical protein